MFVCCFIFSRTNWTTRLEGMYVKGSKQLAQTALCYILANAPEHQEDEYVGGGVIQHGRRKWFPENYYYSRCNIFGGKKKQGLKICLPEPDEVEPFKWSLKVGEAEKAGGA